MPYSAAKDVRAARRHREALRRGFRFEQHMLHPRRGAYGRTPLYWYYVMPGKSRRIGPFKLRSDAVERALERETP
jgi:hypothetical protein